MLNLLYNVLLQLFFTVGIVAIFGLGIWGLNRAFYKLMGNFGRPASVLTGFIGVPAHEIGHAIFCIIFMHKVKEIRLYQPNARDGTMGYVNHLYNRKNAYHQIGNFFIGLGPIILGSAILLVLMMMFLPEVWTDFARTMLLIDSFTSFDNFIDLFFGMIGSLFDPHNFGKPLWWLFMLPACSIAIHMSLSYADIVGSLIGLLYIAIIIIAINILLLIIYAPLVLAFTQVCMMAGTFILNFLTISIILSIILVIIASIFHSIKSLLSHRKVHH